MDDKFNTAAGWALFAGIVGLGLSSISGRVLHSDRPEEMGYPIEVAETGEGAQSGPDLGTLLAAGDVAAGEKIFAKCRACHTIDAGGADGTGPNLNGVMGSAVGGHSASFSYSSALKEVGGTWDYAQMDAWLTSPKSVAAGTTMSFPGLGKAPDRANLMLFLRANGGGPSLPEPQAPAEEEAAAEAVEGEEGEGEGDAAGAADAEGAEGGAGTAAEGEGESETSAAE